MRASGTGHQDAQLAGFARSEGLTEGLGGLGVILGQKVAGSLVLGLGLLALALRGIVVLAGRGVGRSADLDGDGHGRRGDGGVLGTEDELVDDLVAFDGNPERTDLAAVTGKQLAGGLGTRDVPRAVVVGEVDASVEDLPLHLAAEEVQLGDHGDGVTVGAPAADGSEEVDAIGDRADGNLHLPGEGLGVSPVEGTALEHDDVQTVLGVLGIHHFVGHAVGLNLSELREGQRVALGLLAGVETRGGRGGEDRPEVEQAEAPHRHALGAHGDAAKVGDDVAEAFGAEGFEALGHEGIRRLGALGDVGDLELGGLSAGQLELHEGRIFTGDERRILRAVLHAEVPGAMLVVHHAVGVDDVHEHLGGRMGSDALQVGPEFVALVADLVADGAGGQEDLLALGDVARLLDLGTQAGDEVVLRGAASGVELGQDGLSPLGDGGVGVTDELGGLERAELHRGDRLRLEGVEQQRRPLGTAHEGVEDGGAEESG